jgi:hypothetical protein
MKYNNNFLFFYFYFLIKINIFIRYTYKLMRYPFLSTYYKLFTNSHDCDFLSFTSCENLIRYNQTEFIKNIKNVDYFIVYEEYELNKLKEIKNNVFTNLLQLQKIYFISSYDKNFLDILNKYEKYMIFGLKFNLNDKLLAKSVYNIPNKVINLYIEKHNLNLKHNITNYFPSSCITIDLDNAKEYKISNLPNRLKIFNILKSLNLMQKIKLPKNATLIFHSHLLTEHTYYHNLFKQNKNNPIVINYFSDETQNIINKKFCEKIIIKYHDNIQLCNIIYKTLKLNEDTSCDTNNIFIFQRIKTFFENPNNSKYIWKYFTNTFIDVFSSEYYVYYPIQNKFIKSKKYDKNLFLINLMT